MREIKFRAWSKEGKMMLQNAQDVYDGSPEEEETISTKDFYHFFPTSSFGEYLDNEDIELMQFTGLHDKNGKEIYEGDIVQFQTFPKIGIVDYIAPKFLAKLGAESNSLQGYEVEVIGNIYESPELLKQNV